MHYGRFSRDKNRWVKVEAEQVPATASPNIDVKLADEGKIKSGLREGQTGKAAAPEKPSIPDNAASPQLAAGSMAH